MYFIILCGFWNLFSYLLPRLDGLLFHSLETWKQKQDREATVLGTGWVKTMQTMFLVIFRLGLGPVVSFSVLSFFRVAKESMTDSQLSELSLFVLMLQPCSFLFVLFLVLASDKSRTSFLTLHIQILIKNFIKNGKIKKTQSKKLTVPRSEVSRNQLSGFKGLGWVALTLGKTSPESVQCEPILRVDCQCWRAGLVEFREVGKAGVWGWRASAYLKWAVVALFVISWECGLHSPRFPEFSSEAGNVLLFKSWQLIQFFDKYSVSQTKCLLAESVQPTVH